MPQFLDPSALWYLAAALPAITLLYFLKLKRQPHAVSSTLLWRRSVHDMRVNAPMQMIRRNLLLLLQLLIAALVILALARPFTKLTRAQGRQSALIIDCSASMATKDVEGMTRLEAAKQTALKMIDDLGVSTLGGNSNDELCIIAAADRPVPVCPLTAQKDRLRAAVKSIKIRDTQTDMNAAIEMAVAITGVAATLRENEFGPVDEAERAETQARANVIIMSDGAFQPVPRSLADRLSAAGKEADAVGEGSQFIRFGEEKSDNLAIVTVDLRTDPVDLNERKLFVRVENMSSQVRTTTVEVTLNDEFLDYKDVEVGPFKNESGTPGQAGAVFAISPTASGLLKVELRDVEDKDSLEIDDCVYSILEPPSRIRTLLVTEDNYFLENALSSDSTNLAYDVIKPSAYPEQGDPMTVDGQPYEITIFDRWAPKNVPLGASFFIGVVPKLPGIKEIGSLYAPTIVDWNRTNPLMRNLTLLDRLAILRCRRMELGGGWAAVIDAQGLELESLEDLKSEAKVASAPVWDAPLLACRVSENRRVVVQAFDIFDTQRWVMRVSFPLFIRNTTHWLARPGGLQQALLYRTGETLRVRFENDVKSVSLKTPDGRTETPARNGARSAYYSETQHAGLYRITADGKEKRFAFNLLSSAESDNRARAAIQLGEKSVESRTEPIQRNTDLWPYVVLAALAFLVAEWYVYNRRILG